ncbi:glycosyltransferase [Aromatoleum toluclasticum]|uniref:glycosyltransferase n=1 Tax=Aromatoleum toluclasticum TaxID=92003 RepID=UPI001D187068|nr:glycosyltransferase [Aromatoleum toluclasticum]MCC4114262.1 glycosyltransferase [Aromatoleum toluclasticum]
MSIVGPGRHIALLLPELEAGGAQRVMLLLAREFAARGHRVDLVLLQATGPLLAEIPDTVRLVDLAAREHGLGQLGFTLSSIRRLGAWLKKERPEALLSTITGANLVAILARRAAGIPLRLVIREAVTLENHTSTLRRRAMRWLYPHADAVIALTDVMAEQLVRDLAVPPAKIHCIPNPVDAARIRAQGDEPLAHPWLQAPDLKVVISAGRLIPQKDYATLLRAFALLPATLSARLIIVGEGPERARLETLAAELGIADRVTLPGFDANPWRWMARADLFVLSSRWEGHPNALLEALELGLPAVITDYDASAHSLLPTGKLGIAAVGEPNSLANAMCATLRDGSRTGPPSRPPLTTNVDRYLDILRH